MMLRSSWAMLVVAMGLGACGGGGGGGGDSGSGPAPVDTSLGTSAGTGNAGALFASVGGHHPDAFVDDPMPALDPQIVVCTYVGGAGEQVLRAINIASDGTVVSTGTGFTLTYSVSGSTWSGAISGDTSTNDSADFSTLERPPNLPNNTTGQAYVDTRHSLTYRAGFRQVDGTLQQPWVRALSGAATTWEFWNWSASAARGQSLTADSRTYDVFPMPDGDIGIRTWSDGGNTTLNRDPRSITANNAASSGAWQSGANSMGTYVLRANPLTGKPISGTFVRGVHATYYALDAWGRLYLPRAVGKVFPTVNPSNPFAHSANASSGLFVLAPDLKQMAFNARIGGTPTGVSGTRQSLMRIALRDNIVVLAGTTSATDLVTTANAVQSTHGGGNHDGFLVIIRLWGHPAG